MEGAKLNKEMMRAKSFIEFRDNGPDASPKYQTATPTLLRLWRRATVKRRSIKHEESDTDTSTPLDDIICLDSFLDIPGHYEPHFTITRETIKSALHDQLKSCGSNIEILADLQSHQKITPENAKETISGWTQNEKNIALLACALFNRSDLMSSFLASNVDMSYYEPKLGFNALHISCFSGAVAIVDFLISHGLTVNILLHGSLTALHCAALGNCPDAARSLIAAGALINKIAVGGETILHAAARAHSSSCLRIFVEHGADISALDSCGISPLHVAADLGDIDCVRVLVDSGRCDIEQTTIKDQNTALHFAAQGGCLDVVTLLLDRGAQANAKNSKMKTPLHFSSRVCIECTEVLLRRGADPNTSDIECRTPLHAAVSKSEVRFGPDITTLLLTWNANVNAQDRYGYTPLHIAALNELTECVESLLTHNADVSARTRGGTAALGLIARKTPTALSFVRQQLDSCITCNDPEVSYREVRMSFNFKYLLRGNNKGEMGFLQTLVDEGQRELLEHPLCEAFLHLKWQKIGKYYTMRLSFCFLLVFLLSAFILTAISYQCYEVKFEKRIFVVTDDVNSTLCNSKYGFSFLSDNPLILEILWHVLLVVTILEILRKLFALHGYKSFREFLCISNLTEWYVVIAVFSTCIVYTKATYNWQSAIGGFASLFGWANLMVMVGQLPDLGAYVAMYTRVQKEFAKLLAAYVCLLIGFTVCFCAMFVKSETFENPFVGFIKILAMMVGEFEFSELFKEISAMDGRLPPSLPLITFVLFLFFVTIILINLMIGIAVHDIQGLQKTAGLSKLVGLTNLISDIESALFFAKVPVYLTQLINASAGLGRPVVTVRPLSPQEKALPRDLMRTALEVARQARCKRLDEKRAVRLALKNKNRDVSMSGNQDVIDLLLCLSEEVKELKRLVLK